VATGELHENIFQARLPCGEVRQLRALLLHRRQQCGNGVVGFVHLQREKSVVVANGLHTRQTHPYVIAAAAVAAASSSEVSDGTRPRLSFKYRAARGVIPFPFKRTLMPARNSRPPASSINAAPKERSEAINSPTHADRASKSNSRAARLISSSSPTPTARAARAAPAPLPVMSPKLPVVPERIMVDKSDLPTVSHVPCPLADGQPISFNVCIVTPNVAARSGLQRASLTARFCFAA
jgi:hypothetical protein